MAETIANSAVPRNTAKAMRAVMVLPRALPTGSAAVAALAVQGQTAAAPVGAMGDLESPPQLQGLQCFTPLVVAAVLTTAHRALEVQELAEQVLVLRPARLLAQLTPDQAAVGELRREANLVLLAAPASSSFAIRSN